MYNFTVMPPSTAVSEAEDLARRKNVHTGTTPATSVSDVDDRPVRRNVHTGTTTATSVSDVDDRPVRESEREFNQNCENVAPSYVAPPLKRRHAEEDTSGYANYFIVIRLAMHYSDFFLQRSSDDP